MVTPQAKKILMAALVGAFLLQTALVYSDEPTGPIEESALRGRELWHDNGCQVCHQLYGQGGFLGPDLTNAYSRLDSTRLSSIMDIGSGQMPAFGFDDDQTSDLSAFLRAMDRPELGRGQLRLARGDSDLAPWDRFAAVVAPMLADAPEASVGWEAMQTRVCTACHLPLSGSPVGAPDLTLSADQLSAEELRTVLTTGRVQRGMPPPTPTFSPAELDAMVELLSWLSANRGAIASGMEASGPDRSIRWRDIPWWEYP